MATGVHGDEIVQVSNHELQALRIMLERGSTKAPLKALKLIFDRHLLNKELDTINGKDSQLWQQK